MGYSSEVLERAGRIMSQRRETADAQARQRRQELYLSLPILMEMEDRLRRLAIDGAKTALLGTEQARNRLPLLAKESLAIQEEIRSLLRQANLPSDFLEIKYHCPLCQDTGYLQQQVCGCLAQLRREVAFTMLKGGSPVEKCTFSQFSLEHYPTQPDEQGRVPRRVMERILQQCRSYVDPFRSTNNSLLFMGDTGLGKTHLSLAIAQETLNQGYGVLYISAYQYVEYAERFKFHRTETTWDVAAEAQSCDLLILDDLGAEFSTSFSVAALQSLINQRLVEGRPTIVSTNFNVEDLGRQYGERLKSRLICGFQAMAFCGKDVRFILRRQNSCASSRPIAP